MAFDVYGAINNIYKNKVDWDTANKAQDKTGRDQAAQRAVGYYNLLRNNGYGNVADQLAAVDYSGAKKILDQYSAFDQTKTKAQTPVMNTGVSNEAYNTLVSTASAKNNKLDDTMYSDHNNIMKKYDSLFGYANNNVADTDEYKSAWDNVMPYYSYKAMQGRDNAQASGGATNGGNVDSFSAANAMRQQAALTAQGQMIAHQMGIDTYNARVNNAQNILKNLGAYNDNMYSHLENTRNFDAELGQRVFENDETAKNNEMQRLLTESQITGNVPKSLSVKNNPFLNADGTVKDVYLSKEFDDKGGFETIINDAIRQLRTETDSEVRRGLENTINQAREARLEKLSLPQYAPWAYQARASAPGETADYRLSNKELDNQKYSYDTDYNKTKYVTDSQERQNAANNASAERITGATEETKRIESNNALEAGKYATDKQYQLGTYEADIKNNESAAEAAVKNIQSWTKLITDNAADYAKNAKKSKSDVITEISPGQYKIKDKGYMLRVANQILAADDLADEEAKYLLDAFGIDEDTIAGVRSVGAYGPVQVK